MYKNFDDVAGLSFFPYDDHTYVQAPYQEVTEEGYSALLAKMPESIDWSELSTFEKKDHTVSNQVFACRGDVCEIVDISQ